MEFFNTPMTVTLIGPGVFTGGLNDGFDSDGLKAGWFCPETMED